jgi:hypothetical protein
MKKKKPGSPRLKWAGTKPSGHSGQTGRERRVRGPDRGTAPQAKSQRPKAQSVAYVHLGLALGANTTGKV